MGIIRVQVPPRDPGLYPRGRRCPFPGCATILHRNNPGPTCEVHAVTPFTAQLLSKAAA